jgi:hypothetical protein
MNRPMRVVLLMSLIAVACSHVQRQGDVDAIWSAKEQDLLRAAREWKQDDLMKAVSFFETTTGIRSHLEVGYLGVLPARVDESLVEWRSWYRQNRPLLRVNPVTGRIEKKPLH